ncbi:hypothetical protein ON010_g12706 [Phytophthora cinnamomi]|nr:hypothetical protein ON010_g12706 [Phytophthora cinnamomi]
MALGQGDIQVLDILLSGAIPVCSQQGEQLRSPESDDNADYVMVKYKSTEYMHENVSMDTVPQETPMGGAVS